VSSRTSPVSSTASPEDALARVRAIALGLPETTERPSHGAPTFFVAGKRSFATFHDDHHGDGRLALWCAAPPEAQALLVASARQRYFVPPYVGHRGWVGLRLDRDATWDEVAGVLEDAWLARAPARLLEPLTPAVSTSPSQGRRRSTS
jgi:hypothetical protein